MMIPDDVGMVAFHGDAELKRTLLERLEWYETEGDTSLKTAMLQAEWHDQAQRGAIFNPYPKIVQAKDSVGLRIGGDVSTLYALGNVRRSQFLLVDSRIYLVNHGVDDAFDKLLGIPPTLVCILGAISKGLLPERETSWLRQFWAAVPVGASLWRLPMRLILWALFDSSYGIVGLSAADAPVNEAEGGTEAVQDFLTLYRNRAAGDKTDWFSFYTDAESSVKNGWRYSDEGEPIHDLSALERCGRLAAAAAARSASIEEAVVTPLTGGTLALQIVGQSLSAPGNAIFQAGLCASERNVASSVWYEACASVLLNILADCPVLVQPNG